MNTNLDRLRRTDNRSQLKKHLMQTQALQQYNVNLSSGTEKNTTYASLMYEKNDEATIKRGYERFMVNFNNTYKFTPWLAASVAGTFQRKKAETSGVTVAELRNLAPYELLLEEDGSYAYNVGSWNRLIAEDLNLQNLPYKDLSYNMLREVCNRKYTTEEYENACSILRKNFTHPAITTDVIVGFPGETEEEFAQTKEYLKRIHFYEMHIFKYSRRQGTRAAVMEHQVPEEIKTKRSAQLLALAESMSREFRAYYVGKEEEVLFEEPMEVDGETWYTGYTKEYVKIAAKTAEPLDNVMKRGRVEAALTDEIYRMKL